MTARWPTSLHQKPYNWCYPQSLHLLSSPSGSTTYCILCSRNPLNGRGVRKLLWADVSHIRTTLLLETTNIAQWKTLSICCAKTETASGLTFTNLLFLLWMLPSIALPVHHLTTSSSSNSHCSLASSALGCYLWVQQNKGWHNSDQKWKWCTHLSP